MAHSLLVINADGPETRVALVEDGYLGELYIERKPSREDKRTKLLHLTKSGAELLREIMPSVERAQARMLQPLKPADRKTLLALLTQLVDLNNEASRVPLRAEDALEHLGKSN